MVTFHHIERMIDEAEKYIWFTTDQMLMSTAEGFKNALLRGVEVRSIEPVGWRRPEGFADAYTKEQAEAITGARRTGRLKEKAVETLPYYLYMSEKRVAALGFPTRDKRIDFLGFQSDSPSAHRWCEGLFQDTWSRGETLIR